jgi:preprotein translocase subunit YajC
LGETLIMVAVMFALLYFMMIRPENKRKKEAQAMRDSLSVGDEITTIGGLTGTICQVKENTIVLESGVDRVRVEFTKWAVSSKGTPAAQPETK